MSILDHFLRTSSSSQRDGRSAAGRVLDAMSLHRQRAHLSRLDPHLMKDIGISEEAREAELERSLWTPPTFWKR